MAVSRPVHPRQPRQATRPEEQKVRVDEVGVIGRGEACEPNGFWREGRVGKFSRSMWNTLGGGHEKTPGIP